MSLQTRKDPISAFNFRINLLDSTGSAAAAASIALTPLLMNPLAGFNECTGLEMTLETEDYEEGGNNGTVLKFPKRNKWGDITLKKGLTHNTELFDWFYAFSQGICKRKDGIIILMNERHEPHTAWNFRRGLPVKYVAPQLNAQQNSIAVETLTIAHEGLHLLSGASGLASAVQGVARSIGNLF